MTLNLDTGKVLWDTRLSQIANGDATVSNDLVFTTTFDGYLLALARNDGQAVCRKKLPAFTNAPIAIEGDTNVSTNTRIPVAPAMRLAARRPSSRHAAPPSAQHRFPGHREAGRRPARSAPWAPRSAATASPGPPWSRSATMTRLPA